MNMYAFSEKNNREMGILLTSQADLTVFNYAKQEAESILNHSIEQTMVNNQPSPKPLADKPMIRTTSSHSFEKRKEDNRTKGLLKGLFEAGSLNYDTCSASRLHDWRCCTSRQDAAGRCYVCSGTRLT